MTSSGTTSFNPSIADIVVEAFARIQLYAPQLQTEHIVEARRSLNLILADWSANRSVNLWAVDLLQIPFSPGVSSYLLPPDTIQVLDVYNRLFTQGTTETTLGNTLTPMLTVAGVPIVNNFGDPAITSPGSGTFSATAGSQIITMNYPSHGLRPGDPIFLAGIVSIGALALSGTQIVYQVIDVNTITFIAPTAALETQSGQGAPPLLQTTANSGTVFVIYPNHGLVAGDTFNVWDSVSVGGITLQGTYAVQAVQASYQFSISAGTATSSTAAFINGGVIDFFSQQPGQTYTDIIMYGLSRTEYASIPEKQDQGFTTSFWFDRTMTPTMWIWPVPQAPQTIIVPPLPAPSASSPTSSPGPIYGMSIYRMRQLQDANPVAGQTLDMPERFLPALSAELTAAMAEKFKPEMFPAKMQIAQAMWTRAAQEDREIVPLYITPGLSGYYR